MHRRELAHPHAALLHEAAKVERALALGLGLGLWLGSRSGFGFGFEFGFGLANRASRPAPER